jgi:hypothetical protein
MASEKVFAYGILESDTDTWLLRRPAKFILLDVPFPFDLSLVHKDVSAIGTMGQPPSAPGITKLLVEKLVGHEAIAVRAFEIYSSGHGGSSEDNWLRAERELLHGGAPPKSAGAASQA